MKKDIHSKYYEKVKVQCICGAEFEVNAAVEGPIKLELCPSCHPAYTGKLETKVVKGRMEKFMERQKRIESLKDNK